MIMTPVDSSGRLKGTSNDRRPPSLTSPSGLIPAEPRLRLRGDVTSSDAATEEREEVVSTSVSDVDVAICRAN